MSNRFLNYLEDAVRKDVKENLYWQNVNLNEREVEDLISEKLQQIAKSMVEQFLED